jgi:ABC-type multidrug transport system fused ATPase/permease subunit
VLLGGVILIVGFWLAGLAYGAIRQTGSEFSSLLAQVARVAIIALVLAMGLRAMGIADDIVNLGFALTFGAIAVAIALAFGLGGREAAGKQLDHWLSRLRRGDDAS